MESNRGRICGPETLGMVPQNWDEKARNFGTYLIPPVMQAQIEIITTDRLLIPMKRKVLKALEQLIQRNQIGSWFTIYLSAFILLHNCTLLTRAEIARAARHAPRKVSIAQSA